MTPALLDQICLANGAAGLPAARKPAAAGIPAAAAGHAVLTADTLCFRRKRAAMGQAEEPPGDLKRLHDVENVTHSMQQDARLGRRITFFHLGNLVGCGETGPIPADPKDPRTESYITGRIG